MIRIDIDRFARDRGTTPSAIMFKYSSAIVGHRNPKGKSICLPSSQATKKYSGSISELIVKIQPDCAIFTQNYSRLNQGFINVFNKNFDLSTLATSTPQQLTALASAVGRINDTAMSKVFDYKNLYNKIVSVFKDLDFRVCFYCNRNYITGFTARNKRRVTYHLDHYYNKDDYPYLALSFYNLVPCCSTCNSVLKLKQSLTSPSPYDRSFEFDDKVKFILMSKNSAKLNGAAGVYKDYIDIFKLNEVYAEHGNDIEEVIDKIRYYPPSYIEQIALQLGYSSRYVMRIIYGEEIFESKLDARPLSKLRRDIGLKLLKDYWNFIL